MVPGVIFFNRDIRNMPGISFRDVPFLALGKHLDQSYIKPPSQAGSHKSTSQPESSNFRGGGV